MKKQANTQTSINTELESGTERFCGDLYQVDDQGNLKGDLCLEATWAEAHVSGRIAVVEGKTNGKSFQYDISIKVGEAADGKPQLKKVGELKYTKLPHEVRGLVVWGSIILQNKAVIDIPVFKRERAGLVQAEDGSVTSAIIKHHHVKPMTAAEKAQYMPPKERSTGSLM